jgi:hypothetical protein
MLVFNENGASKWLEQSEHVMHVWECLWVFCMLLFVYYVVGMVACSPHARSFVLNSRLSGRNPYRPFRYMHLTYRTPRAESRSRPYMSMPIPTLD